MPEEWLEQMLKQILDQAIANGKAEAQTQAMIAKLAESLAEQSNIINTKLDTIIKDVKSLIPGPAVSFTAEVTVP
jgi:hypothetical protein